jgi:hypothetical protein
MFMRGLSNTGSGAHDDLVRVGVGGLCDHAGDGVGDRRRLRCDRVIGLCRLGAMLCSEGKKQQARSSTIVAYSYFG